MNGYVFILICEIKDINSIVEDSFIITHDKESQMCLLYVFVSRSSYLFESESFGTCRSINCMNSQSLAFQITLIEYWVYMTFGSETGGNTHHHIPIYIFIYTFIFILTLKERIYCFKL